MVGLETAHNLLIDFLWAHGYTQIYVLPPNLVKSNQGRHRQSGAKDDRCDATLMIAELVRTDRSHLYPWRPRQPPVATDARQSQLPLLPDPRYRAAHQSFALHIAALLPGSHASV